MELESFESRINGRFDYLHPITSLIMGDTSQTPDKSPIQGEIVNISNGGLGMYVGEEIMQGTVMLVRIPAAGTEAIIPTLASVQWVKKNCNGFHIGLKFVL